MSGLIFTFQEMFQEIDAIGILAKHYIDKDSSGVLETLKANLGLIQYRDSGASCPWEIPRSMPLRTRPSMGEYEPKEYASRPHLVAELTSIWTISPMRVGREKKASKFALGDLASTVIRLFDADVSTNTRSKDPGDGGVEPIAEWHMEFGDAASPGCYFHVQVPWKPHIPIPRLPTYAISPLFAFEFMLGELFQNGWTRDASVPSDAMNRWRSIQIRRLKAVLDWQRKILERPAQASPWIMLKQEKPTPELLGA